MELYGGNLHLLCSFTGGFILHRNDLWPNLIKIIVLAIFCLLYLLLFLFNFGNTGVLIISAISSLIVLSVEIVVVFLNKLLDKSIDLPEQDNLVELEPELPRGISAKLWSRRKVLFDSTLTVDDRVFRLIQEGFDPEEIFRLNELIESGQVTEQTTIGAPTHRIKPNLILINGTVANIQLDRETLSRTFLRPPNAFYIAFSFLVTFIMTFLCSNLCEYITKIGCVYLMLIPGTATFSLLLPPSCDPYSTTLNDPSIGFTRSTALIIFTSLISLLKYLDERNFLSISHRDYYDIEILFANCCILLPFLIVAGFIGHPVTSIHYFVEVANKYLFGIAGSPSLYRSLISFASYLFHFTASSLVLKYKNNFASNFLVVIYFSFVVQFCYDDFSRHRFLKVFALRLFRGLICTVSAIFPYFIHFRSMQIIPIVITVLHFINDIVLPYISTHQSYFILHGRLIRPNKYVNLMREYFPYIFVPFYVMYLIQNYKLHCTLTSLLIIQSLNISQSVSHIYAFALLLSTFTFHFEFSFKSLSLSLLISLSISRKLMKVSNILRVFTKRYPFLSAIYSDPYTNTFEFLKALLFAIASITQPHISLSFSFFSIVWSCLTGSPASFFLGFGIATAPSAPRPNCFYDDSTISFEHEEFYNIKTNSPIEVPVYVSLTKYLESSLFSLIKSSKLGLVEDDSFFLLVDNDFVAILHIIEVGPARVSFQLRGLEYEQQTLCHNGELSVLQQIILEQREFGNLGHAILFHFSMFNLVEKGLDLNIVNASRYNYNEIVFAVLGSETTFQWFFRACAYIAARDQTEFIDPDQNYKEDESNASDNFEFDEFEKDFIDKVFQHFQKKPNSDTLSLISKSSKFIFSKIKGEDGCLNSFGLLTLFNGSFDNKDIEDCTDFITDFIIRSTRFGVLLSLNASVDLSPSYDDLEDFFSFMNENEEQLVLPLSDETFLDKIINLDSALITLASISNEVFIVRFSKSVSSWAVFKLETESIRGFWANEANNILFQAITSNERISIQFELHFLRNITNQSCNQPIGYPVLVSNVNFSLE